MEISNKFQCGNEEFWWAYCSKKGCKNRVNRAHGGTVCYPHISWKHWCRSKINKLIYTIERLTEKDATHDQ